MHIMTDAGGGVHGAIGPGVSGKTPWNRILVAASAAAACGSTRRGA
jgi:hypothetical protein